MSYFSRLSVWLTVLRLFFFVPGVSAQTVLGEGDDPTPSTRHYKSTLYSRMPGTEEAAKGSPWFSPSWLHGQVNFTNGKSLPVQGNILFLKYDKSTNRLYGSAGDSADELKEGLIHDFHLDDSLGIHSFTKLPFVSRTAFFEVLSDEKSGFMLYRSMISRLHVLDKSSVALNASRDDSTYYADDIQYLLVYPDKHTFLRFRPDAERIRTKLSRINKRAAEFIEEHSGPVTHQLLLRLCDVLNESPDQ